LLGGEIDILNYRDIDEKLVCPTHELAAKHIGGDHADQIEENKETDNPQAGDGDVPLEKIDRDLGHQRV
jgi:hypothetical protein